MKLTISELARNLHVSRKTLSKIVNERGAATPDMALRLSKAFGTSAALWLNVQTGYDLRGAASVSKEWEEVKTLVSD